MATILPFRQTAARRVQGTSAAPGVTPTVIIFPGVRYERLDGNRAAAPRSRRKRKPSRDARM